MVDRSGGFEFSDKHAAMLGKLFKYEDRDLATDLVADLDGRVLTVYQVKEYVLVNTPAYKYKGSLKHLEQTGQLKPVDPPKGRRRGRFSDDRMRVRFVRKVQPKEPTLFDIVASRR